MQGKLGPAGIWGGTRSCDACGAETPTSHQPSSSWNWEVCAPRQLFLPTV